MRKEPKDVAEERKAEAAAANAARRKEQEDKNESKKRMKGKNKPSRRQKKKQNNIIEVRTILQSWADLYNAVFLEGDEVRYMRWPASDVQNWGDRLFLPVTSHEHTTSGY